MKPKLETYTRNGWVACTLIRETIYARTKKTRACYVQLLPARNIVKRWPEQVRPIAF